MRLRAHRLPIIGLATLALTSCTGERGPLPPGPALGGYASAGKAESYTGVTLYGYMDGGADTFLEYGFSSLAVRRYTRGSTQVVVELYTMRDAAAAVALYSSMRRPGSETEIAPGCRASLGDTEVRVARGARYLVCRDENPLAKESDVVRDLCARLVARLEGDCGVGTRFAGLPSEGRVAGSEVALAGPLGLNQRAWLARLGREGFKRGVLATYAVPSGRAEVLLADYASAESARTALEPLTKVPHPGTSCLTRGRRLVLVSGEGAAPETLPALASRFAADGR
jgi:hypothetical protein